MFNEPHCLWRFGYNSAESVAALGVDASIARELPGLRVYGHREKAWRAGLTEVDRRAFAEEGGDLLIELGYEKDDAWIDRCSG